MLPLDGHWIVVFNSILSILSIKCTLLSYLNMLCVYVLIMLSGYASFSLENLQKCCLLEERCVWWYKLESCESETKFILGAAFVKLNVCVWSSPRKLINHQRTNASFTFSSLLPKIRRDHPYFVVQRVLVVLLVAIVDHNLDFLVNVFNVFQISLNLFSFVHKSLHLAFQVLNVRILAVRLVQSVQDPDGGASQLLQRCYFSLQPTRRCLRGSPWRWQGQCPPWWGQRSLPCTWTCTLGSNATKVSFQRMDRLVTIHLHLFSMEIETYPIWFKKIFKTACMFI